MKKLQTFTTYIVPKHLEGCKSPQNRKMLTIDRKGQYQMQLQHHEKGQIKSCYMIRDLFTFLTPQHSTAKYNDGTNACAQRICCAIKIAIATKFRRTSVKHVVNIAFLPSTLFFRKIMRITKPTCIRLDQKSVLTDNEENTIVAVLENIAELGKQFTKEDDKEAISGFWLFYSRGAQKQAAVH